jgi:hypothetical protein
MTITYDAPDDPKYFSYTPKEKKISPAVKENVD